MDNRSVKKPKCYSKTMILMLYFIFIDRFDCKNLIYILHFQLVVTFKIHAYLIFNIKIYTNFISKDGSYLLHFSIFYMSKKPCFEEEHLFNKMHVCCMWYLISFTK